MQCVVCKEWEEILDASLLLSLLPGAEQHSTTDCGRWETGSPAESLPDLFQDFGIWQVTHSYSWEPCLGCCLMQVNLASQPGCCEGRLTESQNGLDWNGPFKCHLIPNPLPCTRTPFTWSAYSVQCPAWPWMLPRIGHSLLMAPLQPGQCLIWSFTSGQGCCFLPSLLEIFWMWL